MNEVFRPTEQIDKPKTRRRKGSVALAASLLTLGAGTGCSAEAPTESHCATTQVRLPGMHQELLRAIEADGWSLDDMEGARQTSLKLNSDIVERHRQADQGYDVVQLGDTYQYCVDVFPDSKDVVYSGDDSQIVVVEQR